MNKTRQVLLSLLLSVVLLGGTLIATSAIDLNARADSAKAASLTKENELLEKRVREAGSDAERVALEKAQSSIDDAFKVEGAVDGIAFQEGLKSLARASGVELASLSAGLEGNFDISFECPARAFPGFLATLRSRSFFAQPRFLYFSSIAGKVQGNLGLIRIANVKGITPKVPVPGGAVKAYAASRELSVDERAIKKAIGAVEAAPVKVAVSPPPPPPPPSPKGPRPEDLVASLKYLGTTADPNGARAYLFKDKVTGFIYTLVPGGNQHGLELMKVEVKTFFLKKEGVEFQITGR